MNGGRENITRVVNHWSLPFSLVVRVLNFLQNNNTTVRRESIVYIQSQIQCSIAKSIYLGLPFTVVLGVGNGRGSPLTIFFIIPVLRLKKKHTIQNQNEKMI